MHAVCAIMMRKSDASLWAKNIVDNDAAEAASETMLPRSVERALCEHGSSVRRSGLPHLWANLSCNAMCDNSHVSSNESSNSSAAKASTMELTFFISCGCVVDVVRAHAQRRHDSTHLFSLDRHQFDGTKSCAVSLHNLIEHRTEPLLWAKINQDHRASIGIHFLRSRHLGYVTACNVATGPVDFQCWRRPSSRWVHLDAGCGTE